jgi:hypothetical protein
VLGPQVTCVRVQGASRLLTKQLALRPFGSAFELRVRQGRAPGPWPPAATLGDVQLSQTLTGLSAREREVSPTPFIPTRRWALAEPPCTPWQLIQLGPKRGRLPSLDSPRLGSLAVNPCTLSGVSDGETEFVIVRLRPENAFLVSSRGWPLP